MSQSITSESPKVAMLYLGKYPGMLTMDCLDACKIGQPVPTGPPGGAIMSTRL